MPTKIDGDRSEEAEDEAEQARATFMSNMSSARSPVATAPTKSTTVPLAIDAVPSDSRAANPSCADLAPVDQRAADTSDPSHNPLAHNPSISSGSVERSASAVVVPDTPAAGPDVPMPVIPSERTSDNEIVRSYEDEDMPNAQAAETTPALPTGTEGLRFEESRGARAAEAVAESGHGTAAQAQNGRLEQQSDDSGRAERNEEIDVAARSAFQRISVPRSPALQPSPAPAHRDSSTAPATTPHCAPITIPTLPTLPTPTEPVGTTSTSPAQDQTGSIGNGLNFSPTTPNFAEQPIPTSIPTATTGATPAAPVTTSNEPMSLMNARVSLKAAAEQLKETSNETTERPGSAGSAPALSSAETTGTTRSVGTIGTVGTTSGISGTTGSTETTGTSAAGAVTHEAADASGGGSHSETTNYGRRNEASTAIKARMAEEFSTRRWFIGRMIRPAPVTVPSPTPTTIASATPGTTSPPSIPDPTRAEAGRTPSRPAIIPMTTPAALPSTTVESSARAEAGRAVSPAPGPSISSAVAPIMTTTVPVIMNTPQISMVTPQQSRSRRIIDQTAQLQRSGVFHNRLATVGLRCHTVPTFTLEDDAALTVAPLRTVFDNMNTAATPGSLDPTTEDPTTSRAAGSENTKAFKKPKAKKVTKKGGSKKSASAACTVSTDATGSASSSSSCDGLPRRSGRNRKPVTDTLLEKGAPPVKKARKEI